MTDNLTAAQYQAVLRQDFATFAARCFHELNPQATLAMNWHLEIIAAKLTALRQGKIRRLIINLPPAASEIPNGFDRVSGLVPGPRPLGAASLHQLCPGSR